MTTRKATGPRLLYLLVRGLDYSCVHQVFGRYRIATSPVTPNEVPTEIRAAVGTRTCVLVQTLYGEYGGWIGSIQPATPEEATRGAKPFKLSASAAKDREDGLRASIAALNDLFAQGASEVALFIDDGGPASREPVPRGNVGLTEVELLSLRARTLCVVKTPT